MDFYEKLKSLSISYEEIEHEPVKTVEEANKVCEKIDGVGCKNLFLKSKENRYYLVLLEGKKRADLQKIASLVSTKKVIFASDGELKDILNVEPGSVTPMAILYDKKKQVTILIDEDLVGKKLLVHPNQNTKTMSISFSDLVRWIESENHGYILINQEEKP